MSENRTLIYRIPQLPDPSDPNYQQLAAGDVRSAITTGCEHLLRTLAHALPGSCSVDFRFIYERGDDGKDSQSRLNLYLLLRASNAATARNLDGLIQGGPLSRFYQFVKIEKLPKAKVRLFSSCDIVRREDLIAPLHPCDLNFRIPERYYTVSPLVPNKDNDYMLVDRVLDRTIESVVISISVQSADASAQLHAHAQYLACLADINHSLDGYDECSGSIDYTGSGGNEYLAMRDQFRPLAYRDPLANDILKAQREIHKLLFEPLLFFRIRVLAETESTSHLVCSVLAASAFSEGRYRIIVNSPGNELFDVSEPTCQESEIICVGSACHTDENEQSDDYKGLRPLVQLATVEELLGVLRLPVATARPLCCRKHTDPPQIARKNSIVIGYDEQSLIANGSRIPRVISIDVLRKHLSLFGLHGYGKTTSNTNTLYQLDERLIPFLALECAKREYRVLKRFKSNKEARFRNLAKRLQVYTPGAEDLSPFRFNPFQIVPGISVIEHIESLMSCFKASIPVSAGSLPSLLAEALVELYYNYPDPDHPPIMTELIATMETVLATKRYSSDTRSDMQTAIEVRLGMLTQLIIGTVFQCRHGISIEQLMKAPTLIELDRLPPEQACLLVLFLLVQIRAYLKTVSAPPRGLRYAILIEETHVIFGSRNNTPASEEIADTKSAVADFISKMLVELRALGVAVILSDQHPSALDTAACKSVGSIVAFRQTHRVDREELGKSMNLKDYQEQDLARLLSGRAYMLTEGYFEPLLIRTPNLNEELRLIPAPDDEELIRSIRTERWFKKARAMRIVDELSQLKGQMDKYDALRGGISSRVKKLLEVYNTLLAQEPTQLRGRRFAAIARELRTLREKLTSSLSQFEKGAYRRFSYLITADLDCPENDLRALAKSLKRRYQAVCESATQGLLCVIDRLIKNCMKLRLKETNHAQKK